MKPYKWDRDKWQRDDEWWNPYNPAGRLKGKGTTTWTRQEKRRKKREEEEREEEEKKGKSLKKGQPATLPEKKARNKEPAEPLEKKAEKATASTEERVKQEKPLEKEVEKEGKKGEEQPLKKEAEKDDKKGEEQPLKKEAEEGDKKEEEKPLEKEAGEDGKKGKEKPLEKEAGEEGKKEEGKSLEKGQEEDGWTVQKSKRKVQEEKREAKQKEQRSYLDVVVKGGTLEKGHGHHKKKGKVDEGYVGLGNSSSSSSNPMSQPSPPPQPKRLKGTPSAQQKESFPERRPPTPPRKKPLEQRLALDWRNCMQVKEYGRDLVPDRNIRAVWDLQAEGWEVCLLSFAGNAQGERVRKWAKSLPIKWADITIVGERKGPDGKAAAALHLGCTHLVDDHAGICQESLEKGLLVFPICLRLWIACCKWTGENPA